MVDFNDRYVAMLYQKFPVRGDIYLLAPYEAVTGAYVNFTTGKLIVNNKNYFPTFSDRVFSKRHTIFYDFLKSIDDLKKEYQINDESKVAELYINSLKDVFLYVVLDENTKQIKTILTRVDDIKNAEVDKWWYAYGSLGTEEEQYTSLYTDELKKNECIIVPRSVVNKLNEACKKEEFDKISCFFDNIFKYDNNENLGLVADESFLRNNIENINIEETLEKVKPYLDELNNLVGLENVKKDITELVKYLVFIDKTKDVLDLPIPNLHMIFKGNAGTGKTTVARLVGKILYELGYAKSDSFAEITSKDIIGNHIGETAIKTSKFISENRGGVIFVDEAYAMAGEHNYFSQESLAEIMKEMENGYTIFIFAGYKKEMDDFIKINSGLESRVSYHVDFKDYSKEQLYEMFIKKLNKSNLKMDPEIKEVLYSVIEEASSSNNFGNGRFIDKLFDKIARTHSNNFYLENDLDKLTTIVKEDVNSDILDELLHKQEKSNEIGFSYYKK